VVPAAEIIVDVADELFTAIERGDEPRLDGLLAGDVAVWRAGAQRDDDKERAMKVLRWFIRVTAERSYQVLDRQLFADGFVQQHILHATGRNGGLIALRVCIVIKVSTDRQISRIDEYFDPAELAPIMS
jgi:ketosteroid isomerase-like protein